MKHFGWLRKAAASVLALAMFAAAPAALAYSDANLEAPRAKNVVIDGDLSEWDTSRCLRIDSEKQIVDQIEHWDGEADCSMEIYAMWDEENLYIAAKVWDDTPFVYREGFPLDELDAIILFFSTNPNADPNRTAYEATDWRIVQSTDEYDFFNYIDRDMIADNLGWETQGEYGDELVFDDYEAVTVRDKEMGGYIIESKIPLHKLSNDKIAQLVPAAGTTGGFDFSGAVMEALRAADAAILVLSAKDGITVMEDASVAIPPDMARYFSMIPEGGAEEYVAQRA